MSALPPTNPPPLPPKAPQPHSGWQNEISDRGRTLDHILTSGNLSDVTLLVEKQRRAFKVHKLVLASRSPLFEEMFYSEQGYDSHVIPLEEGDTMATQWILQHIYCDRMDLESIDLALEVFRLSEKLMFKSAYNISLEYIGQSIKRNNVLKLYSKIYKKDEKDQPLLKTCRKIISDNGNSVLTSPSLHELTSQSLEHLLREDLRVTSEVVVFHAIVSWCQGILHQRKEKPTPKATRREMLNLLPEIRFLTMTSEEFVQNVVMKDVLTPEECVLVLKCIAKMERGTSGDKEQQTSDELREMIAKAKLSNCIEKRSPLITKDKMRTCSCDEIHKSWLRDREYEFLLLASDNVVLLAFKLQIDGEMPLVKFEISKENENAKPIASMESRGREHSFRTPVHLNEGVQYKIRISTPVNCRLLGSAGVGAKFSSHGFTFEFRKGVYVSSFSFI